jgi:hypothetical protein
MLLPRSPPPCPRLPNWCRSAAVFSCVLPCCRSFDTSFQSLFYNAFCASCINCDQLLQQAQAALASVKPLQRPIFSQKAISNGSLHAMLELCGRPQLLQGSPALIATACVAGMLMYSQAVITGSAAAASDAVQILKSLAPLHAAALSLHPAAEAAAKVIVMRAEADVQATQPLLMQVADNVFAAARLFADSVGLHVNGICLRLLQFSGGVDDALRSIVVGISAAVYRSNCAAPPRILPPRATSIHDPRHLLPHRWCHCAAPQGHDIRSAALYTCVPSA